MAFWDGKGFSWVLRWRVAYTAFYSVIVLITLFLVRELLMIVAPMEIFLLVVTPGALALFLARRNRRAAGYVLIANYLLIILFMVIGEIVYDLNSLSYVALSPALVLILEGWILLVIYAVHLFVSRRHSKRIV